MAWRIEVAQSARPMLAALDPSLRDELLEHAALIADDPLAHLHEGGPEDLPGSLIYEFESAVLHNTRVRALFIDASLNDRRIVLVSVRTVGSAPTE